MSEGEKGSGESFKHVGATFIPLFINEQSILCTGDRLIEFSEAVLARQSAYS